MDFSKTETATDHDFLVEKERVEEQRRLEFEKAHFHESHLRSILKGFTWRIVATSTTVLIAYLVTGEVGVALTVGSIEFLGKILLYYIHERAWEMVPKGSIRVLKKRFFRS